MVTESQHKKYRADVLANLRTAGKCYEEPPKDFRSAELGGLGPRDKATLALETAHLTTQIMISERLGQIARVLSEDAEIEKEILDRVSTGESIVEKLLVTLEQADIPAEAEVLVTMAEDWLAPDGPVTFLPPDPKS